MNKYVRMEKKTSMLSNDDGGGGSVAYVPHNSRKEFFILVKIR